MKRIKEYIEKNKVDLLVTLYFLIVGTAMYVLNEIWLK